VETLSEGVDVVVDDGSHQPRHMLASLQHLFKPLLRDGGYYVIEDMFTNFVKDWNMESPFSVSAYLGRVMQGLSLGAALPKEVQGCTEILCQFSVCWLKKGTVVRSPPWCRSPSTQWGPTLVHRQLACEDLQHRVVYHITSCNDDDNEEGRVGDVRMEGGYGNVTAGVFAEVFPPSAKIKVYGMGGKCEPSSRHSFSSDTQTNSTRGLAYVILDTSTAPVIDRFRLYLKLYTTRLLPGGYYFWKNRPQLDVNRDNNNSSMSPSDIFVRSLYGSYCALSVSVATGSMRNTARRKRRGSRYKSYPNVVENIDSKLCSPNSAFQDVFRVGCDRRFCFVQKHVSMQSLRSYARLDPIFSFELVEEDKIFLKSSARFLFFCCCLKKLLFMLNQIMS
jgi:hypothetical protein